ncbi:hypothetical protein [Mucilaginibacter sp. OK283]|jgi:hypothetical protein|uniref:hypothetical protein n=1 Tax=Mucilaginibacter sp. OK283 TaxID=1881049 RepID=UPI0008B79FFD|nr:hypothetical protein [Mucilaginibacter sp. OK283]SEO43231.1 hypothetical protein SAMN05428947_102347 [Mucilaginibacter sp. OK283]
MVNCNYAAIDEYQLFLDITAEKQAAAQRVLNRLAPRVQTAYQTYLTDFPALCLQPGSLFAADRPKYRKTLKGCYGSPTRSFKQFKQNYSGRQHPAIQELCPYCMLETGWTLDHYVGQTAFPEYAILTKNLVPCCFKCNLQKNETWREQGEKVFINFYDDTFLQHRFLDARLVIQGNIPLLRYQLIQPGAISHDEFALIQRHFDALGLLDKYNKKVHNRLSTEISAIRKSIARGKSDAAIAEDLLDRYDSHVNQYGPNHWETLVYLTLANHAPQVRALPIP